MVASFQRPKPSGRPMLSRIAHGNATRARIERERARMGLMIRTIGHVRATAKIILANLAYNMHRLAWREAGARSP
jgi:hypothetical protein